MSLRIITIYLGLILLTASCSNESYPNLSNPEGNTLSGSLVITGSSTIAPLASQIAKLFKEINPKTKVDLQTGGSSRGISDTRRDIADVGIISRHLKSKEIDLTPHLIAMNGIAIIVNKSNPNFELSNDPIKAVYVVKTKSLGNA